MKILITGCRGQLGTELQHQLANEGSVLGPLPDRLRKATVIPVDIDELDITDREATVAYIRRHQPDTVINCAAATNVDGCETNRDMAFKVNALGPRNLALACDKISARLIHISTDYVFNGELPVGRENAVDAPTDPINAYGRSKLAGEQAVLEQGGHVVRTSWVYSGPAHPSRDFVGTMLRLAENGVDPGVVDDQYGRPSEAGMVASAIVNLAQHIAQGKDVPRILHAAGAGPVITWYEFARRIFALGGHDPDRVRPIPTSEYPTQAPRPANSALDISEWERAGLQPLPAWQGSLERALR